MKNILDFLVECVPDPYFQYGFVAGVAVFFVLYVILRLYWACRRRVKAIVIRGDGGDFVISKKAIFEFLRSSIRESSDAELTDIALYKRLGGKIRVNLMLSLGSVYQFNAIHDELRTRLLDEMQEKLGIGDRIENINLICAKLSSGVEEKD